MGAMPKRDKLATSSTDAYNIGRGHYLTGETYDPDYFALETEQNDYHRGFWAEHADREFVMPYYMQLRAPD